jgi:O-antigen ligase
MKILYLVALISTILGSIVYNPLIGIIGYIFTYNISPLSHWWGYPVPDLKIHYSLFLAIAIVVGIVFHRSKLKFKNLLNSQEILLIIFIGLIWLSIAVGLGFNEIESNAVKMTKVMIILLMTTHVITSIKRYELVLWPLIIAGLYLGYEAYSTPGLQVTEGRLGNGIGGSDFGEGNFLAAHFAMLLPFMSVMFLKGGWKSKILCVVPAIFCINGIILCRSRGVFLAALVGILSAVVFSVPKARRKILVGISIAIVGSIFLVDPGFWQRMEKIEVDTSQMDRSTRGRIMAWEAALSMVSEYPLGIGEGNFKKYVGVYNPDIMGKDTHNTYLRCLAELGILGFIGLLLLIVNAFRILGQIKKKAETLTYGRDFLWHVYGIRVALVIHLASGMSMTHLYVEELYWLLLFPVFLKRSVENEINVLHIPQTKGHKRSSCYIFSSSPSFSSEANFRHGLRQILSSVQPMSRRRYPTEKFQKSFPLIPVYFSAHSHGGMVQI